MERTLQEYHCPECGIYAGTAHGCVLPQFYCCGKRFPTRQELDPLLLGSDASVPLQDKERILRGYMKQIRHKRIKMTNKWATDLLNAERLYKNILSQMEGLAVVQSKSPHKVTMKTKVDRKTQVDLWFMMLSHHASQNGNKAPKRQTFDDCKRYALKHNAMMPEWAK